MQYRVTLRREAVSESSIMVEAQDGDQAIRRVTDDLASGARFVAINKGVISDKTYVKSTEPVMDESGH